MEMTTKQKLELSAKMAAAAAAEKESEAKALKMRQWDLNVAKGYKADADTIWNQFHKLASERGL